jgi:ribosomal protein S4
MHKKSILSELHSYARERDKYLVLESRSEQFISSGINLLKYIEENFSVEEAEEISRRLVNSLKSRDFGKTRRRIRQLKEDQSK